MSLSYQHRYHAGNFADVHKHIILLAVLQAALKKATPYVVLDAFAGEGVYPFASEEMQRNQEYQWGIERLRQAPTTISLVSKLCQSVYDNPTVYPGSPYLIAQQLRAGDQAHFIEKHPGAIRRLKQTMRAYPQGHCHNRDAYEGTIALLPKLKKRGLIFLDPSYELKSEYQQIVTLLTRIVPQFSHGQYGLWYPILKTESYHQRLIEAISMLPLKKSWLCEWWPGMPSNVGLQGSGMLLINPPWQVEAEIESTFRQLNQTVYLSGKLRTKWIHPC